MDRMCWCETCAAKRKSEPLPVRSESDGWLPEWFEIEKKVKLNEKLSALEILIYNNEPAGEPQSSTFRLHVANAIKEANVCDDSCGN